MSLAVRTWSRRKKEADVNATLKSPVIDAVICVSLGLVGTSLLWVRAVSHRAWQRNLPR